MKKGNITKEMILEKAAGLFNSRGYFGASISDVMKATGLEKGGIYNHFDSKDELALAAFDYVVSINGQRLKAAVDKKTSSKDKLLVFIDAFEDVIFNPTIPGGCPLLNCAVESDDAHPTLKEKVRSAMKRLLSLIESIIESGITSGEMNPKITPHEIATYFIASIEGGVMLAKLYEDKKRFSCISKQLKEYIRSTL